MGKYSSKLIGGDTQQEPGKYSKKLFDGDEPEKEKPKDNRGLIKKGIDFVSGSNRTEFPEMGEFQTDDALSMTDPKAYKAAAGMIFSSSPGARANIIKKYVPDATFSKDKFDNDIVKLPDGESVYINKPGFSYNDALEFVGKAALYLGPAKFGAKVMPKLVPKIMPKITGKAAGVGLGTGSASVAEDKISQGAGSGSGVDIGKAGLATAFGAGFEFLGPLVGQFSKLIAKTKKPPTIEQARIFIKHAGHNADDLTDEMVLKFAELSKKAADKDAAFTLAQADSLPVKVPLTKGKVTMNPNDQMFEDLAAKGSLGDFAATTMKNAEQNTTQALRDNIPAIQKQIGGGAANVTERGQGAAIAQKKLDDLYGAVKSKTDEAYTTARAAEKGSILPKDADTLHGRITDTVQDYMPHAETAQIELDILKNLTSKIQKIKNNGKPVKTKRLKTSINDLFNWRRKVSTLARTPKDDTNGAALSKMVRAFDSEMDTIVEKSLIKGNSEEAKLWARAIKTRRLQGKLFESGDMVDALVRREFKGGGAPRLKISPEEAGNYIFGAADTGIISKPKIARELVKIKKLLGPKSKEWHSLREEAFLRFASKAEGTFSGGERGFSGVNFKKAWYDAWAKNPKTMRLLFNKKEKRLINQFANVAAKATSPVKGGANFSNTTPALIRAFNGMQTGVFGAYLKFQTAIANAFPSLGGVSHGINAIDSTINTLPLKSFPSGYAGSGGAVIEQKIK